MFSFMKDHTWRVRDEEGLMFYRATHHGGRWELRSQRKGDEEWQRHDPMEMEHLETLRDLVFNKYQRGRCPWKFVQQIDKLMGKETSEPR